MPGARPYYTKAKDLFIQRRTAAGRFEEWGVTVQPNSWLVCDECNNLITIPFTEFSASSAFSSSWAATSSYFSGSISNAINALFAETASYVLTSSWAISASWAPGADTSLTTGSLYPVTSSWAIYAQNGGTTLTTGSTYPITSSWSNTASFALNAGGGTLLTTGSTYPITSSWAITSSFAISASWAPTSGSIGSVELYGTFDGGTPDYFFGGLTPIDGGLP